MCWKSPIFIHRSTYSHIHNHVLSRDVFVNYGPHINSSSIKLDELLMLWASKFVSTPSNVCMTLLPNTHLSELSPCPSIKLHLLIYLLIHLWFWRLFFFIFWNIITNYTSTSPFLGNDIYLPILTYIYPFISMYTYIYLYLYLCISVSAFVTAFISPYLYSEHWFWSLFYKLIVPFFYFPCTLYFKKTIQ